ncbi:MAG: hypothetical protein WDN66_04260 [Candidatus Saccharibacteria bacterium]
MSLLKKSLNVTPAYHAVKLGSKLNEQHKQRDQKVLKATQPIEVSEPKVKLKS